MEVAVLKEVHPGERRVALAPSSLDALAKGGIRVRVEAGAGEGAGWSDADYRGAGARVESDLSTLLEGVGATVKVRPPYTGAPDAPRDEVALLPEGVPVISFLSPGEPNDLLERLAARSIPGLALERIPRTTRAQRMDALSSQASAAGYQAVLRAAGHLPRFFPMLTTAAGTIPPARVLVLGAGVAGLQAIATARRLGAVVAGYDVRAAAAEQVRSLGATFVEAELPGEAEGAGGYARALSSDEREAQLHLLTEHVPRADVVISTAQIPGKPAPVLITRAMVEAMRPGAVVVDLAAETGGNCELSRPDEEVREGGVTILAPTNLPSEVAQHASEMLGRNLTALLLHCVREGAMTLDLQDDIVNAILVTASGRIRTAEDREAHRG